ncbi:hypothetical protein IJ670_03545 [bacterium]|nr:hypothetical protein [bacterium]
MKRWCTMVEPIRLYSSNFQNVNFKSQEVNPSKADVSSDNTQNNKPNVIEGAKKVRSGFLNFLKDVNEVKGTGQGAIRGVAEGAVLAGLTGLVGKSATDAKGHIGGTLKNIAGDLLRIKKDNNGVVWKFFGFFPKLITDSPLNNVKTILNQPSNFYKNYLKGHKATAAVATVAGLTVAAARTLQGRLQANKANAEIDHFTTRRGHQG